MEPMITISLKDYNELLEHSAMVKKLEARSEKELIPESIPAWGVEPKKYVRVKISEDALKDIYSKLLDARKDDIVILLGD